MESCERFLPLLSARLDGELSREEERELREHLEQCPACRALWEELSAVHDAFPALEQLSAPPGFAQGVMDRIRAREERPKVIPLFRRPALRAAAGLAACVVLCLGIYQTGLLSPVGDNTALYSSSASVEEDKVRSAPPQEEEQSQEENMPQTANAPDGVQAQTEERSVAGQEQQDQDGQAVQSTQEPEKVSPQVSQNELHSQNAGQDAPAQDNQEQAGEGSQTQSGLLGGTALEEGAGENSVSSESFSDPSDQVTTAQGTLGGESEPVYQVGEERASVVLTLKRLPEGSQEILGQQVQWQTGEGECWCLITGEQMQALMALAQEQGQDLTGAVTNSIDSQQLCALVIPASQETDSGQPETEEETVTSPQ